MEPRPELVEALADRYAVEREVGAGGMATVYLAKDLRHGRKVAVKVLRPEVARSLGRERFLREIEIAASLTHPHILPLHDSGEAGGFFYYVMPFIEGESLESRLGEAELLPVPDVRRILREIVGALAEAHARGVVHRDVKPANVLLSGGHALVADFGVAKAVHDAREGPQLTTVGVAVGTPEYMAPEQAAADPDTDHRADLFAVGAIAYEMLTGRSPFAARTAPAVFAAVMATTPEAPQRVREALPEALSNLVMWCLEKDPDDRPQSAAEILERLGSLETGGQATAAVSPGPGHRRFTSLWIAAAAVVVAAGSFGAWRWSEQRALEQWARGEAIPEVIRLIGENQLTEAALLAFQAEDVVGADPVLAPFWPRMTSGFAVRSDPPGAEVSYRPYESEDDAWRSLGQTPHRSERFPVGAFRFRIEREGFEPVDEVRSLMPTNQLIEHQNAGFDYLSDPSYVIEAQLAPSGTLPEGMIAVTGGLYGTTPLFGFGPVEPRPVPDFMIDRTEVTNAAYEMFVAAAGYEDRSHWSEEFQNDGRVLTWEEAMAVFRDSTGQVGPSTWLLGRAAPGRGDHPVAGVSWFEADAYCRWRGQSLPTLYHWARAALPSSDPWIPFHPVLARASNFDGEGPRPVSGGDAMGVSGALDLAGNVREWVSTPGGGDRYLLGGAWSDPIYWLHDGFAAPPWQRTPTDGFRCASYPGGDPPEHLSAALSYPSQNMSGSTVLTDAVFEARQLFSAYDHGAPLADSVESSRQLEWGATEEWVTVNSAYGGRLPIRLHIPEGHEPPYQAIVFFGGGNVVRSREMEDPQPPLDYLVRSGRVLVEPAYDGTFMRNDGRTAERVGEPELTSHWIQDLGRTLDYLEQRDDMDGASVAYLGLSLGASLVPTLLPFEPRFRSVIIFSGGFGARESQRSIDDRIGLARRVRIPLLMLGGSADFHAPIDPHQRAMFEFFGTRDEDKHFSVYDSGHWPLPMNEVIRETVDFLDRYHGPVR